MIFNYKVINKEGKQLDGQIEAANKEMATATLQRREYVIVQVVENLDQNKKELKDYLQFELIKPKVKEKDIVIFSRQVATMFEAGVQALKAFRLLAAESDNVALRRVLTDLSDDIQAGSSLYKSFMKHPEVFSLVVNDGHAIGNHTFNHLKGWATPVRTYVDNVKLCDKELSDNNYQLPISLFRPPYGRITRSQIKALRDYKIIMWDVLTHDYAKEISQQRCLSGSIAATRAGSIIVFHDSLKAEKNMKYALPRFLDHFSNQGFTFESIPNSAGTT